MSFLPSLLGAGASIGSAFLSRPRKTKESSGQKRSNAIIDDLLASMRGQGPYSDLFNLDEAAFQKSFVDPAKATFQNQIAPQIQQSFLAGGQQRGTGLENKLTQAGVDLDQMLNQNYMNFLDKGKSRQSDFLSSILGQTGGSTPGMGTGESLGRGLSGYLQSPAFEKLIQNFPQQNTPKGFFPDFNSSF